ncbi:hypothetical protein GYMLUDRAFT_407943 [Collybiopsis luxurians FD-317 M1]|uniref:Uncharacterized protein n=1 Tax=Collybiopsis luxurians FD-317 M1 TaxID=944289 RepID=A0A0D0B9Y7_9AGAR|nr:hypothetical protein GYMLUDRAFT_407943 [Collybiopsis luxurians FD-317 M1]
MQSPQPAAYLIQQEDRFQEELVPAGCGTGIVADREQHRIAQARPKSYSTKQESLASAWRE